MINAEDCEIFISARFHGDKNERKARALHKALQDLHMNVFMVDAHAGFDFGDKTVAALCAMKTMVAFACENYGALTQSCYSSYYELKYANENNKHIMPVRLSQVWPPQPKEDLGGKGGNKNKFIL